MSAGTPADTVDVTSQGDPQLSPTGDGQALYSVVNPAEDIDR